MDISPSSNTSAHAPRQQHSASQSNPYQTPQSASGPAYSPSFRHNIQGQPAGGGGSSSEPSGSAPPPLPPPSNNNTHPQETRPANIPIYSDGGRLTPATSPPNAPPGQYAPVATTLAGYVPSDRTLPSREVDEAGFENAYVAFVLYCNPVFALDIETVDLRRTFSTPPKSDGHSFSTFLLFELMKKFEAKEIKTWTDLALELGVAKPSLEKGQSSQKVQQYAVRLKVCEFQFFPFFICLLLLCVLCYCGRGVVCY